MALLIAERQAASAGAASLQRSCETPKTYPECARGAVSATDAEQHEFLDLAKAGNWDRLKETLLANPTLVDCAAKGRWTALMQASNSGNKAAVGMLLAMKADPMINGRDGTAVDLAHGDVRDLLLESVKSSRSASMRTPAPTGRGSESVAASLQRFGEAPQPPQATCEIALGDLEAVAHMTSTALQGSKAASPFRINDDSKDVADISYRPMPRLTKEPDQDITQCLRDSMSISWFNGRTSRFVEDLISESWKIAQDRIGRGVLARHPDLTEKGVFALTVFTLQLQAFVDARDEDEFYFQFGNALRYRSTGDMAKMKPYVYHFVKGLEAMPRCEGTLWRGVHGDFAEVAGQNFSLHNLIHFNAYSSASPSRQVAKQFLAGKGLILKFMDVTNSARDVREVSAYPNEDERTILAGTRFIVVKEAHKSDDGIMEIHLKEGQLKQA